MITQDLYKVSKDQINKLYKIINELKEYYKDKGYHLYNSLINFLIGKDVMTKNKIGEFGRNKSLSGKVSQIFKIYHYIEDDLDIIVFNKEFYFYDDYDGIQRK